MVFLPSFSFYDKGRALEIDWRKMREFSWNGVGYIGEHGRAYHNIITLFKRAACLYIFRLTGRPLLGILFVDKQTDGRLNNPSAVCMSDPVRAFGFLLTSRC